MRVFAGILWLATRPGWNARIKGLQIRCTEIDQRMISN